LTDYDTLQICHFRGKVQADTTTGTCTANGNIGTSSTNFFSKFYFSAGFAVNANIEAGGENDLGADGKAIITIDVGKITAVRLI